MSTWCDLLVRNLIDFRFTVVSIVPSAGREWLFPRPWNLETLLEIPLFGVDGIDELPMGSVAARWQKDRRTNDSVVTTRFIPLLRRLLRVLLAEDGFDPSDLAVLVELHKYFETFGFRPSFTSPQTWQQARRVVASQLTQMAGAPVGDAPISQALALFARVLAVLAVPLPTVDLVHSTTSGVSSLPCLVQRLYRGTPYLLTEHGIYLRERYLDFSRWEPYLPFKQLALRLFKNLARANYLTADLLLPVCEYNRRWEERLGASADRIRVVHNGVSELVFRPAPAGAARSRTRVSFVGRICPLKDLRGLIQAFGLVKRHLSEVQLQVYGSALEIDRPYLEGCLSLCRELGLDGAVHFLGRTSQPQLAYHNSDLVVLPSLSEGLPFTVIEAMMSGVPVVATAVGGVPEVLGDCGTLVEPQNPVRLAAKIHQLLTDEQQWRRASTVGREIALKRFRAGMMVDQYRQVYREMARRHA